MSQGAREGNQRLRFLIVRPKPPERTERGLREIERVELTEVPKRPNSSCFASFSKHVVVEHGGPHFVAAGHGSCGCEQITKLAQHHRAARVSATRSSGSGSWQDARQNQP